MSEIKSRVLALALKLPMIAVAFAVQAQAGEPQTTLLSYPEAVISGHPIELHLRHHDKACVSELGACLQLWVILTPYIHMTPVVVYSPYQKGVPLKHIALISGRDANFFVEAFEGIGADIRQELQPRRPLIDQLNAPNRTPHEYVIRLARINDDGTYSRPIDLYLDIETRPHR